VDLADVRAPELERAVLSLGRAALGHVRDELADELGIGQRVVDGPAVAEVDDALLSVRRTQAERNLVEDVRPGMEADLDKRQREKRRLFP
jgi:hypothetical protein